MLQMRTKARKQAIDKVVLQVTDFMRCDIWREGDKKNMRLVKDVL